MRNTDDYLPTFCEDRHARKNYIEGGKQNNIDEQISSIKSNGISQNWTFISNIFEDPRSNSNRFKEMKQEYQDLMKMHQETLQQNRKLKREKEKLNRRNLQKEIEQLQQQNLYLRNKLIQFQSQSRNFYVEELEKNNELLVRENKRILNMIMRKVKLELYA